MFFTLFGGDSVARCDAGAVRTRRLASGRPGETERCEEGRSGDGARAGRTILLSASRASAAMAVAFGWRVVDASPA